MQYQPACRKPWDNALISIDGNIRFCCHIESGIIGNLNKDSFEEIWNGRLARRIRRDFLNGHIPDECRKCPVLKDFKI